MLESEFNQRVDTILEQIENAIETNDLDIDFETAGGILTLEFEDGSKIIINRQTPVRQIWIATRSGGFHFDYNADTDEWQIEKGGTELFEALSDYCSDHAGQNITLSAE